MSRTSLLKISFVLFCLGFNSSYAGDRPAGYITVCTSGQPSCSLSNVTTNVAFGRDNRFIYRVLTGEFVCDASTFGAKVRGNQIYECSVPSGPVSSSIYPGAAHPRPSNYGGPEATSAASST